MGSKKYKAKTCAYCSREGISAVGEHVVCRKFFLVQDRADLPQVPACERCNNEKSKLERYALAILPFGSRHVDSQTYANENLERRLRKDPELHRELAAGSTAVWSEERGVLRRLMALPIDQERLDRLLSMIVRGLFMHEFGFALHSNWDVKVTMFEPEFETEIIGRAKAVLGPNPIERSRDLGRGTFTYEVANSSIMRNFSIWRVALFGGVVLADDQKSLSRFSALTSRKDDVQGPPGDTELSIVF